MQGEFVSVGRLEATYAGNSDLINQMYIYGSGLRSYLLAVVVPSEGESTHPCLAYLHSHLAAAHESHSYSHLPVSAHVCMSLPMIHLAWEMCSTRMFLL